MLQLRTVVGPVGAHRRAETLARWCALAQVEDAPALLAAAAASGFVEEEGESEGGEGVLGQITLDVRRSCHFSECTVWSPPERSAHLAALARLLAATFPSSRQHAFPFYVQGVHDVAAVLLLGMGEAGAGVLLPVLAAGPLRGFLQDDMAVPAALLRGVGVLLAAADPPLAARIHERVGVAAIWALPWLLTWFAHSVPSLAVALALFEAPRPAEGGAPTQRGMLGEHPIRPLYLCAALVLRAREVLLEAEDEAELYSALQKLPADNLRSVADAEALLLKADVLQAAHPPLALLSSLPRDARAIVAAGWPELWWWREAPGRSTYFRRTAEDMRRRWALLTGRVRRPPGAKSSSSLPLAWLLGAGVVAAVAFAFSRTAGGGESRVHPV